ncbi:hypothetical protein EUZ85_15890 [Hahella sp. KA22]|uniref:type II toxin-antitoxin system YafO family toxin n=1 Tax=Hahella sp. KA22 TaxID=1628392 RepID=UPI000FDD2D33|nr:type II toxin-antitoxin system YafO family toxin [Hahella sp. KA22]AZZ92127.1 hypothetical protein ENC22_13325 [Hahella sp. KA22]QAY55498.1 hypothetical protein EUZ85_15890 [Hahella sp. KA22]
MSKVEVKIFQSKLIAKALDPEEAQALFDDFRAYKSTGVLPDTFGRDAPYDHTTNRKYLELQHIHIMRGGKKFPLYTVQFYRTSGYVLVYS